VLDAKFDHEIKHSVLGTIHQGTLSIEYYWLDRWYNVFRFIEPDGKLRNFYCNVNLPPSFDGQTLSYVDLDIDILVEPNFSYTVLDLDEFEQNATVYRYPDETKLKARAAVDELARSIETRAFPFNH